MSDFSNIEQEGVMGNTSQEGNAQNNESSNVNGVNDKLIEYIKDPDILIGKIDSTLKQLQSAKKAINEETTNKEDNQEMRDNRLKAYDNLIGQLDKIKIDVQVINDNRIISLEDIKKIVNEYNTVESNIEQLDNKGQEQGISEDLQPAQSTPEDLQPAQDLPLNVEELVAASNMQTNGRSSEMRYVNSPATADDYKIKSIEIFMDPDSLKYSKDNLSKIKEIIATKKEECIQRKEILENGQKGDFKNDPYIAERIKAFDEDIDFLDRAAKDLKIVENKISNNIIDAEVCGRITQSVINRVTKAYNNINILIEQINTIVKDQYRSFPEPKSISKQEKRTNEEIEKNKEKRTNEGKREQSKLWNVIEIEEQVQETVADLSREELESENPEEGAGQELAPENLEEGAGQGVAPETPVESAGAGNAEKTQETTEPIQETVADLSKRESELENNNPVEETDSNIAANEDVIQENMSGSSKLGENNDSRSLLTDIIKKETFKNNYIELVKTNYSIDRTLKEYKRYLSYMEKSFSQLKNSSAMSNLKEQVENLVGISKEIDARLTYLALAHDFFTKEYIKGDSISDVKKWYEECERNILDFNKKREFILDELQDIKTKIKESYFLLKYRVRNVETIENEIKDFVEWGINIRKQHLIRKLEKNDKEFPIELLDEDVEYAMNVNKTVFEHKKDNDLNAISKALTEYITIYKVESKDINDTIKSIEEFEESRRHIQRKRESGPIPISKKVELKELPKTNVSSIIGERLKINQSRLRQFVPNLIESLGWSKESPQFQSFEKVEEATQANIPKPSESDKKIFSELIGDGSDAYYHVNTTYDDYMSELVKGLNSEGNHKRYSIEDVSGPKAYKRNNPHKNVEVTTIRNPRSSSLNWQKQYPHNNSENKSSITAPDKSPKPTEVQLQRSPSINHSPSH